MEDNITREDLRQFGMVLKDEIKILINESAVRYSKVLNPEWIRSRSVRKLLDISAGSVQNLRTSQKVRFKKVLGSYYYNRADLEKLFADDKE